jgi:hypothetical protein
VAPGDGRGGGGRCPLKAVAPSTAASSHPQRVTFSIQLLQMILANFNSIGRSGYYAYPRSEFSVCVWCDSRNKRRLFPETELTGFGWVGYYGPRVVTCLLNYLILSALFNDPQ